MTTKHEFFKANILINPDGEAIICDFGLSTNSNVPDNVKTVTNRTNDAWLAYEFFRLGVLDTPLTIKTDIFAYGCVCYEVCKLSQSAFRCILPPYIVFKRSCTRNTLTRAGSTYNDPT